jgi:hypothetical protein
VDPREFKHGTARSLHTQGEQLFRVEMTVKASDLRELWIAAAMKAMRAPGTRMEDVEALIGPCEDPEIATCIAMLTYKECLEGCELESFDVEALPCTTRSDRLPA